VEKIYYGFCSTFSKVDKVEIRGFAPLFQKWIKWKKWKGGDKGFFVFIIF
jgi:hypothetical protein